MRPDIIPGAILPDYELTDHTGKRRKLSDLQGPDPMIVVLSRGSFCPKTAARPKISSNYIANWKSATAASSQSARTT